MRHGEECSSPSTSGQASAASLAPERIACPAVRWGAVGVGNPDDLAPMNTEVAPARRASVNRRENRQAAVAVLFQSPCRSSRCDEIELKNSAAAARTKKADLRLAATALGEIDGVPVKPLWQFRDDVRRQREACVSLEQSTQRLHHPEHVTAD